MTGTNSQHQTKIGWIGVGMMGTPIVKNLINAGFRVTVYAADAQHAAEWAAHGADVATEISALAAANEWIFSCIPNDSVLQQVALGPQGVLENAAESAVYVDMSTVSPAVSASVRTVALERAINYLAAPVSGSILLAESAQLTVFASGPQAAFQRTLPAFEAISESQYYVGADEQAHYLKLAINHLLGPAAVVLAGSAGVGQERWA